MIKEELLPTPEDVEFYRKNGYWIAGKVLDDEFLDRCRLAMYQVYASEFETGVEPWGGPWRLSDNPLDIRKVDNAHWCNNTLRELTLNETIGAMAARLAGTPEVRLWHDQLLYKPGSGDQNAAKAQSVKPSANVGWHQDNHYWQCTTKDLLTAWVAFDDVTIENGCMQVVPGSHEWGALEPGDFFDQDLEAMKAKIEEATGKEFKTVSCELKAGELSFHHCLTIHGSGPNSTGKPRRSLVLHLQPDEAVYTPGTGCDAHMNAILLRELGGKAGDPYKTEPGSDNEGRGRLWAPLYSEK